MYVGGCFDERRLFSGCGRLVCCVDGYGSVSLLVVVLVVTWFGFSCLG